MRMRGRGFAAASVVAALGFGGAGLGVADAALAPLTGSPFDQAQFPAAGWNPQVIQQAAAGDLNGDGSDDLATVSFDPNVNSGYHEEWVSLSSSGSFPNGASVGAYDPSAVVLGNFGGTAALDIAAVGYFSGEATLQVYGNSGTGTFPSSSYFHQDHYGATLLQAGDVDGDGHTDLVVGNDGSSSSVFIEKGDGAFHFVQSTLTSDGYPVAGRLVDVNGDHALDLVLLTIPSGAGPTDPAHLTVLLNDGHGVFTAATGSPLDVPHDAADLAAGDITGDGKPDIAVATPTATGGTVHTFVGDGAGGFGAATGSPLTLPDSATGPVAGHVSIADLDGDGRGDVIVAGTPSPDHPQQASPNDRVGVLLGTAAGALQAAPGSPFETGLYGIDAVTFVTLAGEPKPLVLLSGSNGGSFNPAVAAVAALRNTFAPMVAVTPPSVSLSAEVGATTSHDVTVQNPGDAPLHVTSIGVTGDGFSLDDPNHCATATIAAGGSCVAHVTFAPTAAGTPAGTLTLHSDGGDASVALSGTATAAMATATPATTTTQTTGSTTTVAPPPPVYGAPPKAVFSLPTSVAPGAVVTLDASSSSGQFLHYAWDLTGDGVLDTPSISAPYMLKRLPFLGTTRIGLTVTDAYGRSDTITHTVDVVATTAVRPRIPATVVVGKAFSVDLNTVFPAAVKSAYFTYDFGDGTATASTATPLGEIRGAFSSHADHIQHTYTHVGTYRVSFVSHGSQGDVGRTIATEIDAVAPGAHARAAKVPTSPTPTSQTPTAQTPSKTQLQPTQMVPPFTISSASYTTPGVPIELDVDGAFDESQTIPGHGANKGYTIAVSDARLLALPPALLKPLTNVDPIDSGLALGAEATRAANQLYYGQAVGATAGARAAGTRQASATPVALQRTLDSDPSDPARCPAGTPDPTHGDPNLVEELDRQEKISAALAGGPIGGPAQDAQTLYKRGGRVTYDFGDGTPPVVHDLAKTQCIRTDNFFYDSNNITHLYQKDGDYTVAATYQATKAHGGQSRTEFLTVHVVTPICQSYTKNGFSLTFAGCFYPTTYGASSWILDGSEVSASGLDIQTSDGSSMRMDLNGDQITLTASDSAGSGGTLTWGVIGSDPAHTTIPIGSGLPSITFTARSGPTEQPTLTTPDCGKQHAPVCDGLARVEGQPNLPITGVDEVKTAYQAADVTFHYQPPPPFKGANTTTLHSDRNLPLGTFRAAGVRDDSGETCPTQNPINPESFMSTFDGGFCLHIQDIPLGVVDISDIDFMAGPTGGRTPTYMDSAKSDPNYVPTNDDAYGGPSVAGGGDINIGAGWINIKADLKQPGVSDPSEGNNSADEGPSGFNIDNYGFYYGGLSYTGDPGINFGVAAITGMSAHIVTDPLFYFRGTLDFNILQGLIAAHLCVQIQKIHLYELVEECQVLPPDIKKAVAYDLAQAAKNGREAAEVENLNDGGVLPPGGPGFSVGFATFPKNVAFIAPYPEFGVFFEGDVTILDFIKLNNLYFRYLQAQTKDASSLAFGANVDVDLGLFGIGGGFTFASGHQEWQDANGKPTGKKYNWFEGTGDIQLRILGQNIDAADVVFNNKFIAGCALGVGHGWYRLSDGASDVDWGCGTWKQLYSLPSCYKDGVLVGKCANGYRDALSPTFRGDPTVASLQPITAKLLPDPQAQSVACVVRGAFAAPLVTLSGGPGESITADQNGVNGPLKGVHYVRSTDPGSPFTMIYVPGWKGQYFKLTPLAGSSAITDFRCAAYDGNAQQNAVVRPGPGGTDRLTAQVALAPGQSARLYEVGAAGQSQTLAAFRGPATRAAGDDLRAIAAGFRPTTKTLVRRSVRFTPVYGESGKRKIMLSVVDKDGMPIETKAITTYQARVQAIHKVARVIAKPVGDKVVVSWPPVPLAHRYVVTIKDSTGRDEIDKVPATRHAFTVKAFSATTTGRISVVAEDGVQRDSAPVTVRVKARAKPPKPVLGVVTIKTAKQLAADRRKHHITVKRRPKA